MIPQSSLSLASYDSQETAGSNSAATNAIDGNTSTMWHTQWYASFPPPPHYITLNLNGAYIVQGFRHTPRQDGSMNGTIKQYEFYPYNDVYVLT
jgi:F5/8 type C domain